MSTKVDLSQLAVRRGEPPARRPNLLTRFVLPLALLAGFASLIAYATREALSPPRPVTVMPVITSQTAGERPPDTPLFRAAGWVEPRPTPTIVTALAEGVVERLLVVEGQEVKEGQTVARLIPADARLALEATEGEVDLREGELASARAALAAARARLELPVHLQAELADAETALARAESEQAVLPSTLAAAQARLEYATQEYEGSKKAREAVARIGLAKAFSDMNTASGTVQELQARQKRLPVEVAALKARRDAQKHKLDRRVDEVRQVGEGEAAVKAALGKLRQARAARDAARLRLERMDVRAPSSGRVLALVARPGARLMGQDPRTLYDASSVVTLYDPASLQVRVDVRLDDVGRVRPGQKVRIETAALPEQRLRGEVLLATSQADIQKNTLSVKVAVHDPPAALKPEMLCQVTFLAPPRPPSAGPRPADADRLLVPGQLIDSPTSPALWVVDPLTGTARRRPVGLGLTAGDLVEVVSGLSESDRLIVGGREGLRDGDRVRVAGEDETLGIARPAGNTKK